MNQEALFKVCRFPAFVQMRSSTGPVTVQNYLEFPQQQYTPALSLHITDCSSEETCDCETERIGINFFYIEKVDQVLT